MILNIVCILLVCILSLLLLKLFCTNGKLKHSLFFYESCVNNLPSLFFIKNEQYKWSKCFLNFKKKDFFSLEEFLFSSRDYYKIKRKIQNLKSGNKAFSTIIKKDDEYIHCIGKSIFNEKNLGYIIIFNNITALCSRIYFLKHTLKRKELALKKLNNILNLSQDIVFAFDSNDMCTYKNAYCKEVFGEFENSLLKIIRSEKKLQLLTISHKPALIKFIEKIFNGERYFFGLNVSYENSLEQKLQKHVDTNYKIFQNINNGIVIFNRFSKKIKYFNNKFLNIFNISINAIQIDSSFSEVFYKYVLGTSITSDVLENDLLNSTVHNKHRYKYNTTKGLVDMYVLEYSNSEIIVIFSILSC